MQGECEASAESGFDCENAGYNNPFVLDSYGRMGLSAHRVISRLLFAYARRQEIKVGEAKWRIED